jgi:hypothetical protein
MTTTIYERFDVVCSICQRIRIRDAASNFVVVRRQFVPHYIIVCEKELEEGDIILYPTEE